MNKQQVRTGLLFCGIASPLLYLVMTVVSARLWPGYSSASQTISELSAYGAPTRAVWTVMGIFYTVLVTGFGWGVFQSAGPNRALRTVGGLIVAYGSLGVLWPFAAMHSREVLAAGGGTASDTLHLILATVTVVLMLLAIGVATSAFGPWFRIYSMVTLVVLVSCGALTFWGAPALAANLPTPWLGVWERINVGMFLLWIVVLATTLLRPSRSAAGHSDRDLIAA